MMYFLLLYSLLEQINLDQVYQVMISVRMNVPSKSLYKLKMERNCKVSYDFPIMTSLFS